MNWRDNFVRYREHSRKLRSQIPQQIGTVSNYFFFLLGFQFDFVLKQMADSYIKRSSSITHLPSRGPCYWCFKAVKWVPVLFIVAVIGWSYYAYVIQLCFRKFNSYQHKKKKKRKLNSIAAINQICVCVCVWFIYIWLNNDISLFCCALNPPFIFIVFFLHSQCR